MTTPRVCFMVLSHTEPDLVERLVRVLTTEVPDASVIVRHDGRTVTFDERRMSDLPQVHVHEHREDATWGSWALTLRTLEGVRHALALEEPWDWLVLISGQSYPIRPLSAFVEDLGTTEQAAVLTLAKPEESSQLRWTQWRPYGADRARYRYRRLPWSPLWELHPVRKALLSATGRQPFGGFSFHHDPQDRRKMVAQAILLAHNSPLDSCSQPTKASQWWALSRPAVDKIAPLADSSNTWHQYFSGIYTSDELAIPTMLHAEKISIANRPLHAMRWPSGPSPSVLTIEHLPWLQTRDEPFARKVSVRENSELLDALDTHRTSATRLRAGHDRPGDNHGQ